MHAFFEEKWHYASYKLRRIEIIFMSAIYET